MKYYAICCDAVIASGTHIKWMRSEVQKHITFNKSVWGWCDPVTIVTSTNRNIETAFDSGIIMKAMHGAKIHGQNYDRFIAIINDFEKRVASLV